MGAGQTTGEAAAVELVADPAGCLAIATSFVIIAMSFFITRPPNEAAAVDEGADGVTTAAMETEASASEATTPPPPGEVPERPSAPSPKEDPGAPFNTRTETVVDDQGNIFVRNVPVSSAAGGAASDDNADVSRAGTAHLPPKPLPGDLRKSQSMLAFATTSETEDHGVTSFNRTMSQSNLKSVSSFCVNGKSESAAKRPRRNISFGSKEMFQIPTRASFSEFDKQNMWYGHLDVNSFIGNELHRRRVIGIKSTNALCAEPADNIPEDEDENGIVSF